MLRTRIITAGVLLCGLLAALFLLPTLGWVVFCAVICALVAWEWGGLAGWSGKVRVGYGIALGCLCLVLYFWTITSGFFQQPTKGAVFSFFLLAGFFWILVVPLWLWRKWVLHSRIASLIGIIVLVPPVMFFMALRFSSPQILLMVCALPWVADIAGYFFGRTFGGKKLAPNISPGKTWSGAIGTVIGVLVYCNVVVVLEPNWFGMPQLLVTQSQMLLLQLIFVGLAVWSIIGDLFESLLKRQAGVKDSSNLLPGHGGILDRVDSLTSTLALVGFAAFPALFGFPFI